VDYSSNPPVSVTRLQVGLLAEGRSLQTELNRIAETAYQFPEGRTEGRKPASLCYAIQNTGSCWHHPASSSSAEAQFNLWLLRGSNFTGYLMSTTSSKAALQRCYRQGGELDNPTRLITEGPGEYIIVTLLAATLATATPAINNADDFASSFASDWWNSSERLPIEVLWTPSEATR